MQLPSSPQSCSGRTWTTSVRNSRANGSTLPLQREGGNTFHLWREEPFFITGAQEYVQSITLQWTLGDLPLLCVGRMDQAEDAASFLSKPEPVQGIQKRMLAPTATLRTLISISHRTLAKHICHKDLGVADQMQEPSTPYSCHPSTVTVSS